MASDLASEVKLIFRVKSSKGWLCTLMASRGLTESIISQCSLPPIFSIILGNILFLSRTYQQQLFVFVFVLFCFLRNDFISGVRFYGAPDWKLSNSALHDSIYGLHRLYLKRHSVCSHYQVWHDTVYHLGNNWIILRWPISRTSLI